MLTSEEKTELEGQAQACCDRLAMFGLKLDVKNSECLKTDVNEAGSVEINGTALVRTTNFEYLESAISCDGSLMFEVNLRLSPAGSKWYSMTGVLCDRTGAKRRLVAMYGAECRSSTKEVETRLSVMETKTMRWTAGVTPLDRIRNGEIRQRDKFREWKESSITCLITFVITIQTGVTRMDHIRNDVIRQKFGVTPIAGKML
ncbi:unnamed protein product [Heligmosomoides polygyrus]|uniref:DUF2263 domain-containing protein n=1 Tax=Heligmosomoides polygyrus TaxID=6339 RepID=A0A3P8B297_HELPZ|nr:unnamed protein product [Heligmosomoides polygyrus]